MTSSCVAAALLLKQVLLTEMSAVCSLGALPLPADLFTGLNHVATQQAAAPVDPFAVPQHPPSCPDPHPAVSPPSIPVSGAPTDSRARTALTPSTTALLPAPTSAQLPSAAPDGRRKKKTTRRVGYARDDAVEDPVRPALAKPAGSSTAPSVPTASTSALAATAAPSASTGPAPTQAAVPAAEALTGAPLAATHTTAALLDIVSSTPASHATIDTPAPPFPVAVHSTSAMPESKPKHSSPKSGASAAWTPTQGQTRGSPRATARSAKPQKAAAQSLSALADLLPVAVPSTARQDSRGTATLSPRAMVQVPQVFHVCKQPIH